MATNARPRHNEVRRYKQDCSVPLALKETKCTAAKETGTAEAAAFVSRLLLPEKIDLVSKENDLLQAKNGGGTYSLLRNKTPTINTRV